MITRSILAALILLFGSFASALYSSANAALIEITYPEQDVVRAVLSEIDAVDDRVYTLRFDNDGTAEILFGDGAQGARPSSGGSVVASYRFGAGIDGNIVNEYGISENELPFIPIADFWSIATKQLDASFVIVGVTSVTFEFSPDGLRVIDAEPVHVPEPTAFILFALGLLWLVVTRRRLRQEVRRR